MSDQPKPTGDPFHEKLNEIVSQRKGKPTGEWTVWYPSKGCEEADLVFTTSGVQTNARLKTSKAKLVADAHNAALSAEREKVHRCEVIHRHTETIERLRDQLAAERDKANVRETELICERDYFKKELDAKRINRESIESINKSLASCCATPPALAKVKKK